MTSDEGESSGFDWLDFMDLAEELAERRDEAILRTAVSRTYYAVYHCARFVLEQHDPEFASTRGHDSHKRVWDRLGALKRRQAKTAARNGHSLLRKRKRADYELHAREWPRQTQQALEEARRAIRCLKDLLEQ
jgi:uncharacterized protein (UPF0332 family)